MDINLLEELKSKSSRTSTNSKSLSECFKVFTILHRLLNSKTVLEQVTREIFEDFYADNCVYLELRTTPRNILDPSTNQIIVSKRNYIQTVIDEIRAFEAKVNNQMRIRLILSVDRQKGLGDGLENIELANELKEGYVVGVDFSGNPKISSFKNFTPLFDLARKYSLKVTVHTAEFWEDEDIDFILRKIRPDRIGHSVCLTREQIDYLLAKPIPIEICPTSNLITKCVDSIENHPFYEFYKVDASYPLVICTDDMGIFDTTLSDEYELIARTFKLSIESLFKLSREAIGFVFDQSASTISFLNEKFDQFKFE